MTLADALEGNDVKVLKVSGNKNIKQRMLDMGITRGSEIHIERYAPLNDPIHIKIRGYSLALRVAEGQKIDVEKL